MTKTRRYNAIHLAYPSTALFVITLLHYSHRIFHQGVFGCGKINTEPIFTSGKSGKRFSVKNAQITFLSDDSSPSVELLEVSPRIAVCAVPYLGDDFRVCTTAGACLVYLCVCVSVSEWWCSVADWNGVEKKRCCRGKLHGVDWKLRRGLASVMAGRKWCSRDGENFHP